MTGKPKFITEYHLIMKLILLTFCIATALLSCEKPKIKSIDTNNSRDSLTYQPKVAGSLWTYNRIAAGGLSNVNFNFIRLSTDTLFVGKSFNTYSNEADGTQYLRQDGDKYYQILTASSNKPELLVLDVLKNVGESWVGGVNGSDTYTYTMKQKLPVYTLDGFTFKNTLVVQQVRTNSSGSITLNVDTYYAQGVGVVKTVGTISGIGLTVKLITLNLK